ncbi:MAG: citrate transporter [Clostridiales bacterium]|jgi:hypothetical protein|nr:citrate transporter [Clostridiales bacterium]
MVYFLGVLLLLSILGFVFYAVKGKNLMVGFFIVTLLWFIVGLVGNAFIKDGEFANGFFDVFDGKDLIGHRTGVEAFLYALNNVFQVGPANYAQSILVNIFFGALFGQILIKTKIASTVVKKTVELSGDRPRITLALMCIVTTLLFVNMSGIGPVMAIAVIVFPILKTLGIPSPVACFAFMGSIMAGLMINPVNFAQYYGIILGSVKGLEGILGSDFVQAFSNFTYSDWSAKFGWVAAGVSLFIVLIATNLAMGFKKKTYSWGLSLTEQQDNVKDAPWYSWFAILIPVVLLTIFGLLPGWTARNGDVIKFTGFAPIFAFIVAGLYALITTGNMRGGYHSNCVKLSKMFSDGVVDVAPMVGFLLTLAMFGQVGAINAPYLRAIVQDLFPSTALALALVFAVISFASFFRGPTNMVGAGGAAFVTIVLISVGSNAVALGVVFVYALFAILTIAIQHLDITQSWVAWGLGYTNVSSKQFMKMAIPTGYLTASLLCILAFLMLAL